MRFLIVVAVLLAGQAQAFDRLIFTETIPLQRQNEVLLPEDVRLLSVQVRNNQVRLFLDTSEDRTINWIKMTICARKPFSKIPQDSEFIGESRGILFYRC